MFTWLNLVIVFAISITTFPISPTDTIIWDFEELISYGKSEEYFSDQEEIEFLSKARDVIKDGNYFYILDLGARAVIQLDSTGDFNIYNIGGDGPGLCPMPPQGIFKQGEWFALLNPMPLRIIFTDLVGEKFPPRAINLNIFMAMGIAPIEDGFIVNAIMKTDGDFSYALFSMDNEGNLGAVFQKEKRDHQGQFPVFFHRNRWTVLDRELAVVSDIDGSIEIFNLHGELRQRIIFPKSYRFKASVGPDDCLIHALFSLQGKLLVLLRREQELQFYLPKENQLLIVRGVQASINAEYFWLDQDHLAVIYGFANQFLPRKSGEEHHMVTIYRRRSLP